MAKVIYGIFFLLFLLFKNTESRNYTRCGLAKELTSLGFHRTFIGNWVCLVESSSGKKTDKLSRKSDGSIELGLFQINSKVWCTFKKKGGKCNMKCEDLLNEDITDDSKCVQKVHQEKGFRGWPGWKRSCYMRYLPLLIARVCF
ncbi:unnamed protein product [Brassicogethes aeneus]|uniref:lysozyme n=1 Tax=Brassicogethes aeneus TaxID=1431903 RepID=A0A9P0AZJ8_BRAAE|nr:unnamed protein product [Brassicogethes aeneus]